jgi:uncharacterized protein YcaQ
MRIQRKPRESLSAGEARRVALAAQGFDKPRPTRPVRGAAVVRSVRALGLVQIDSVNVLVRSHYLPAFSRLGRYDPSLLDEAATGRRRRLFEYWGHEASLIPVEHHPLLRWRMRRAREGTGTWGRVAQFGREQRAFCEQVLQEITVQGPLGVSDLQARGERRKGGWWGWSHGKVALEWLFWTGQVTTHSRRQFERVYDLPERVLPAAVLARPTPGEAESQRELLCIASRALGVATERDLRDYFRLPTAAAKVRLAELVSAGLLRPVSVEGWRAPAFVTPQLRIPRKIEACALVSPFDSLVWERDRMQRLFDFHYRIEIYTPAHKRKHGYYVLPFLLGDRLVARVDLKADRPNSTLRVISTHLEPWADPPSVKAALREELATMANWLRLDRVSIAR